MRLFILFGCGAAEFAHAMFLETKVAPAECPERFEQRRVDRISRPSFQCITEVFSHFEDHFVILIDALNASGVLVAPLHP